MPIHMPDVVYRPAVRLQGTFAPGTSLSTGVAIKTIVPLANCIGYAIRILSTAAGSLAVAYLDPSARFEGATLITSVGTNAAYATGVPRLSPVAVTANTEAILPAASNAVWNGTTFIMPDYNGEAQALVTFTPSGNGTLTWCDLCQIQPSV